MRLHSRDLLRAFALTDGAETRHGHLYSLPALEANGIGRVSRLPVCLRMILESLLRHLDGPHVSERHVLQLAYWQPRGWRSESIPLIASRVVLQETSVLPLLCDLATLRDAAARNGRSPERIEPLIPVDVTATLQERRATRTDPEFRHLMEWAAQAFEQLRVLPAGVCTGQQTLLERQGVHFPETLIGTEPRLALVNAFGMIGCIVSDLEAEAAMFGQPARIPVPDVIGVHLHGRMDVAASADDLRLSLGARLGRVSVQGQLVEFFGDGAESLSLPERATVAGMAAVHGARAGFFAPDEATATWHALSGCCADEVETFRRYFQSQQLWGTPRPGDIDYSQVLEFDLAEVKPGTTWLSRRQHRLHCPGSMPQPRADLPAPRQDVGMSAGPTWIWSEGSTRIVRSPFVDDTDPNRPGLLPIEDARALLIPAGDTSSMRAAAQACRDQGSALIIFAGTNYGAGASAGQHGAAKTLRALGVSAVVAVSFDPDHRTDLVAMGVLPLQFSPGDSAEELGLQGHERFDLISLQQPLVLRQQVLLRVHRADRTTIECQLLLRIDTPAELAYLRPGGLLPFLLKQLLAD
jgi:aconitate hydratase